MFFLRFIFLIIIILGALIYLLSNKIRVEFFKISGENQPLLGTHSEEFNKFCENPPSENISRILKLKKKLSIALIISIVSFLLAILSAIL